MTAHLLAISIGPVQEFIAAARRTRDLWFGSHLLSEISKAAAKALHSQQGELIFPADAAALDDPGASAANVVLARLPEGSPREAAQCAHSAARHRWLSFARPVFDDFHPYIRRDLWEAQVDDFLEFFAAWVPESKNYDADRQKVMRLLEARKRCRDFRPATPRDGRAGIRKSSLDGLRESVIVEPEDWPKESGRRRRLRLAEGEQLDAVGLIKRAGGGDKPYPSVSRVAADPWLRGLDESELQELAAVCRSAGDLVHSLDVSAGGQPQFKSFPFEGTVVYRSRHRDLQKESDADKSEVQPLTDVVGRLVHHRKEPSPYLALLAADGDQIGKALSSVNDSKKHQAFSRALAAFAAKTKSIVNEHRGVLIYAGGDDVTAFLPVDQCLACARALHEEFQKQTAQAAGAAPLTLSVGVAIAHFMEPLEDLLAYARAAEKHAKNPSPEDAGQQPRDGLAVHLHKRGGGPIRLRGNWSEAAEEPIDRRIGALASWVNEGAISGRVAYDLRKLAETYDGGWEEAARRTAIVHDCLAVLRKKRPSGASRMDEIAASIRLHVRDAASLRRLSEMLLIARIIAEVRRQTEKIAPTEEVLT